MIVPGIIVTPQIISSLGSLANGMLEVVSSPDPSFPTALDHGRYEEDQGL